MPRATNMEYIKKLEAQLAEAKAKAKARAEAEAEDRAAKRQQLQDKLQAEHVKKVEAIARVTEIHDGRIAKVEEAIAKLDQPKENEDVATSDTDDESV